jgi:uncharacterized membrane protein
MIRRKINKAAISVILLVCIFILFFSWFTIREFERGMLDPYDQTVYRQSLWTTLNGKFFWCSFAGLNGLCDLGVHMHILMLLLLPVYMLFPFPVTFSILQVFFLGISAILVYLIAKEKINNSWGILFVILYLTNTFTIQSIIEGFQSRVLSVPILFFTFYFLIKKRYLWVTLFLFLLALSHEINSTLVFTFGIYIILTQRKILLGFIVLIFGISWFIASIKIFQPYFGIAEPMGVLHFIAEGKHLSEPMEIIQYCFFHPIDVLKRTFTYPKLDYLIRLFAPLGFLSLLSLKELLIGLPVFLQNLFLSEQLIKVEIPRYTMPLLPFIFISAIYSVSYIFKKARPLLAYVKALVLFFCVISTYKFVFDLAYNPRFLQVLSPIPQGVRIHREAIKKIAELIPSGASVCADVKGFHFLAHRFKLYDMPFHVEESDYVLIDKKEPTFSPKPIMPIEEYLKIMNETLESSNYEIIKEEDRIILLKTKR